MADGLRSSGRARIVVVDDEPDNLDLLARVLEAWDVVPLGDPYEALEVVPALSPALLLTDFRMPSMDGVELVRRLRAAGVTCPAMLVTGYADGPTVVRALREKLIERIVAKPYEPAALRAEVELTMRLASARSSVNKMKSRLGRR